MRELQANVQQQLRDPATARAWRAATGGTPQECPPIYSFDNPSIHKNNKDYLRELGLMELDKDEATTAWLVLPRYSGDLHRTIERTHARVCDKFQAALNEERTARTMEFYIQRLFGFFRTQDSKVITKCMSKLPQLYQKVIELNGAKPPRPFK